MSKFIKLAKYALEQKQLVF